jgi:hypothetical protein
MSDAYGYQDDLACEISMTTDRGSLGPFQLLESQRRYP